MLIILGEAKLGEGALDAARDAINTLVEETRKEEGCISYSFASDVCDPSKLLIVEKWVDGAALAAHFAMPHMAAFQTALAGIDMSVTELKKYEADDGAPLG